MGSFGGIPLRAEIWLALTSLVLAAAAVAFLLLSPCVQKSTHVRVETQSGASQAVLPDEDLPVVVTECKSLREASGPGVVLLVTIPLVLTLVCLGFAVLRWRIGLGLTALALLVYFIATGFSIGIFFAPAWAAATLAFGLSLVENNRGV